MRADYCWRHVQSVSAWLEALRGQPKPFALPGTGKVYPEDRPVVPLHHHLDVKVDPERELVEGRCSFMLEAVSDGATRIRFDAVDLEIQEVYVQGRNEKVAFTYDGRQLDVPLWQPAGIGERFTALVVYRVEKPRLGLYFIKPSAAEPDRPVQVWSQNQDDDARYWFPCMDHPGLKMTTSVTATVPTGYQALSNGVPAAEGPQAYHEAGWHTFLWQLEWPHPVYLLTLVVGKFSEHVERLDDLEVRWYCLPGREADAERAFGKTPEMIRFFSEFLGVPYPYPRYGQVAVSEFIFGGMENTTLTTQTDRCLYDERAALDYTSDGLVAHELAHQWFGDFVTCREWAHAWLNEGFATYFDALFVRHDKGEGEFDYELFELAEDYFREDRDRYRRPVVSREYAEPIDVFDRHLYHKGAWVLHMLRTTLGEDAFRRGLHTYLQRYGTSQAETNDLRRAVEDATGRSLGQFFDQWIFEGGYPEIAVSLERSDEPTTLTLTLQQGESTFEHATELLVRAAGETRRVPVRLGKRTQTVVVAGLGGPADLVVLDPDYTLLGVVTPKLPVPLLAAWLAEAPSVARRVDAARALGRELGTTAFKALEASLRKDPFWGVRKQVASVMGGVGTPAAEAVLVSALAMEAHPKARRGIANALGGFTGSAAAAAALRTLVTGGDPSYFVEGEAATALGRTRTEGALEPLRDALGRDSFNEVIRAGALAGLGALRTEPALAELEARLGPDQLTLVRTAAIGALGHIGRDEPGLRGRVLDRLKVLALEREFRVQSATVAALETISTPETAPILDRIAEGAGDGRVRRKAREAGMNVRKKLGDTMAFGALRDDIERLKTTTNGLRDRVDRLGK